MKKKNCWDLLVVGLLVNQTHSKKDLKKEIDLLTVILLFTLTERKYSFRK